MSSRDGWRQVAQSWWLALFMIAGAGGLAWIASMTWTNIEYWRHGIEAEGTIIDVEHRQSTVRRKIGSGQKSRKVTVDTYIATIEYADADGHRFRFVPEVFSGAAVMGARVPIRFLSAQPGEARVDGFAESWLRPLFWTPFALLSLLGPAWMLVDIFRSAKKKSDRPVPPAVPNPPRSTLPLDQKAIDKSIARQRGKRTTL